ncbi:hypothetical protein DY000_02026027 [Brassica cretica]|uniref:Uncharacterized protein n=1 Tax=Brassica cretica TaxID=69181 RepID=A0ABQ7EG66_BRACR|nr:hypothetical protein DY000_02026027 [Brassica cretica]
MAFHNGVDDVEQVLVVKDDIQLIHGEPIGSSSRRYGVHLTPFDQTKKMKKTLVVQDAIEDSAESHGRHTICGLIVQEEFIGYIAEHPNDEEEVEGIDLHQQRYLWEGSDMDYLYDELLSMEITLEIDGTIFDVPNANANSNVDSQL